MVNDPKQYSLKPVESQVLKETQKGFQQVVSNILSMIAIERLAYQITDKTQFVLSNDFTTMTITEPEAEPEIEVAGQSAKDAIKGAK